MGRGAISAIRGGLGEKNRQIKRCGEQKVGNKKQKNAPKVTHEWVRRGDGGECYKRWKVGLRGWYVLGGG